LRKLKAEDFGVLSGQVKWHESSLVPYRVIEGKNGKLSRNYGANENDKI
jgi:hypothetical protein